MNEQLIVDYKNFLNNGKTERECVEQIIKMANKKGYKDISKFKKLSPGDKVYIAGHREQVEHFIEWISPEGEKIRRILQRRYGPDHGGAGVCAGIHSGKAAGTAEYADV